MPQSIPRWASISAPPWRHLLGRPDERRDWWRRCKPSWIRRAAARWLGEALYYTA